MSRPATPAIPATHTSEPEAAKEPSSHSVVLNRARFDWALDEGRLSFFGLDAALFWTEPSLARLLEPLAAEMGRDLYTLLVAHSSSIGTEEDYNEMVTTLGHSFEEGFCAWGRAVSAAGWGAFSLRAIDWERKTAQVEIEQPWELRALARAARRAALGLPVPHGQAHRHLQPGL